MLAVDGQRLASCEWVTRRAFLQAGALGIGGLTLPGVLRRRAQAAPQPQRSHKAVIMICLNGGPSHIDMYDMKPLAPREIRGEFRPIPTKVPGLEICELMPRQAELADKFSVVRSLKMIQPNHQLHECYTGFPTDSDRPAFGSAVSAVYGRHLQGLPRYVSLSLSDHPRTTVPSEQPRYLGQSHAPFEPNPDMLESMTPSAHLSAQRLPERKSLLDSFDQLRRHAETSPALAGQEAFTRQALDILTSSAVRDAFDVTKEPQSIRDLYGGDVKSRFEYQFGHTWRGACFLQARRLVEAGVPVVTLAPGAWDHHGGPQGPIFDRLRERLPLLDRSLAVLIADLYQRGMDREVLVVVWGEFGRTPRVNAGAGRDHWTRVNFVLFSGGGLPTGQVIGATDGQGAEITTPPYGAQNVLAMIYRHLGIAPDRPFTNFAGRPVPLLDDMAPIRELS